MYFFAGGLTIICGVLIYFVLPSDPIRAKGFNDRERFIAVSRMRTNNSGVRNTHFKGGQAIELLTDIKFWLIFFYALCGMFANAPISTFQAIIIDGFGFNPLNSLLLMIPSGVYAGTMMLITTYLAYKFPGWRAYIVIICQLITMAAALMLWLLPRSELGGLLFACYILTTTGAGYAVIMGLFLANNAGYTKRSLASSGLYIGYSLGRLSIPHKCESAVTDAQQEISPDPRSSDTKIHLIIIWDSSWWLSQRLLRVPWFWYTESSVQWRTAAATRQAPWKALNMLTRMT